MMFNHFEMCGICHQPVCLHVEEIMRLSNDLAESNMWREKLSDKIDERDAELATLAQTANELRAENERLRGELVDVKRDAQEMCETIMGEWHDAMQDVRRTSAAWKALARRAREQARQMAEDDTTLRRLVDHGNEWEVRITRVKDEREALRARLEAAERVIVKTTERCHECSTTATQGSGTWIHGIKACCDQHAPEDASFEYLTADAIRAWLALREKGDTSK